MGFGVSGSMETGEAAGGGPELFSSGNWESTFVHWEGLVAGNDTEEEDGGLRAKGCWML